MTSTLRPVAGRLARPSWRDPRLLVGVVLIAASVAAVVSLVRAGDRTEPFYAARSDLPAGAVLDEDDVLVVQVRVDGDEYVSTGQEPWGEVLARPVGAGELVPVAALVSAEDYDTRPVAVRSTRPVSDSVRRGSLVDVWLTVTDAEGEPASTSIGTSLAVADVAADDGAFSASGGEIVYVNVPQEQMADFLDALAVDGEISVVGLAG